MGSFWAAVFNIVAVVALLAFPAAGAEGPPEHGFSGQNTVYQGFRRNTATLR